MKNVSETKTYKFFQYLLMLLMILIFFFTIYKIVTLKPKYSAEPQIKVITEAPKKDFTEKKKAEYEA